MAVRLIVEREREIEAFKAEEFWRIIAKLSAQGVEFEAALETRDGQKLAITNEAMSKEALGELDGADYIVAQVVAKDTRSNPSPPFTTSTLQQTASTVLRFPAKKTMRLAQDLYEGMDLGPDGAVALITYMRTDSVRISNDAVSAIREHIAAEFGKNYLPGKPRAYVSKGKTQEAHEAVRPTYIERTPESVKPYLVQRSLPPLSTHMETRRGVADGRGRIQGDHRHDNRGKIWIRRQGARRSLCRAHGTGQYGRWG